MGIVTGKKALVRGIANERSLAYAIGRRVVAEGGQLAVTYQGEVFEERVRKLSDSLGDPLLVSCDVTRDDDIERTVGSVGRELGGIDMLVHAIAYADKEDLVGPFYTVSRAGFLKALEIGAYPFTAVARAALPLMENRGGGSMLTLTYFGAEKVIAHYNVMAVTKAALEASVRYLANDFGHLGVRVNASPRAPSRRCRPRE